MRASYSFLRPFTILFFLALLLCQGGVNAEELDPAEQDALLKSVIAQNTAALKKTESMYVDFSWQWEATYEPANQPGMSMPGGPLKSEGHARIWRSGSNCYEDLDLKNVWISTGQVHDVSSIIVYNDRYLAKYHKRAKQIEVYRFENRQSLYAPVDNLITQYPYPDILDFGFGTSSRRLAECFEKQTGYDPPRFEWSISKQVAEDKATYLIKSEHISGENPGVWYEFVVDPDRGFLVTEHRAYDKFGKVRLETTVDPQLLSGGQWFPKTVVEKRSERETRETYTVNEIHLGESIPDFQFEIEAMDFEPEQVLMKEFASDGRKGKDKGYWGGEWVPLAVLPPDALAALRAAQKEASNNLNIVNPTKEFEK